MSNVRLLVAVGQSEDPERRPGWPRESGELTGLHLCQNQAAGTVFDSCEKSSGVLLSSCSSFGGRLFSVFIFYHDYFSGMILLIF